MNISGPKINSSCIRLMDGQWIPAWLLIISLFTVVYGIARIKSEMMPLIGEEKLPENYPQEYREDEKCQRGLNYLIAINELRVSNSAVPVVEQVRDRRCTMGDSDSTGVSLTIRVSLIL